MAKKLVQTTGTILDKLEGRTLTNIVHERKYLDGYDEDTLPEELRNTRIFPKDACIREIKRDLAYQIVNQFIQHLTQKELIRWTKNVIPKSVLSTRDINNPTSMNVMKKRLKEHIEAAGLRGYVRQRKPSCELLRKTLKSLNPEFFDSNNPKYMPDLPVNDGTALLKMIYQQLNILALEYILFELSVKTLQQMVEDSELNIKTQSKPMLVRNLVEMTDYKPRVLNIPKREKAPIDDDEKPKNKKKDKENQDPDKITARTKLSNLQIVFTDDENDSEFDEKKFRKLKKKEYDLSIESENDADKHPPALYDSEYSYEESDSDFDAKKARKMERKLRREEKKKRKEMKMKSRSKRSRKYESFTSSSSDDSDKKHSKKKSSKKHKKDKKAEKDNKDNKDKDGDQNENPKDTENKVVEEEKSDQNKPKKVTPEPDEQSKNTQQKDKNQADQNNKTKKHERSQTDDNSVNQPPKKKKSNTSNSSKEEAENETNNKTKKPDPPIKPVKKPEPEHTNEEASGSTTSKPQSKTSQNKPNESNENKKKIDSTKSTKNTKNESSSDSEQELPKPHPKKVPKKTNH